MHINERYAGSFRRVVSLPEDADPNGATSDYRDGEDSTGISLYADMPGVSRDKLHLQVDAQNADHRGWGGPGAA